MKKKMITVDVGRCLGCHACAIACAIEHSTSKTLVGALQESPRQKPRVHLEYIDGRTVAMRCQHCEDAPCITVCPSGALQRAGDGEPVTIDQERCIGCLMCVQACPFGMITVNPDGKGVLKCDLCVERLEHGRNPACVDACPTGALKFEIVEESNRAKRRKAAEKLLAAGET